MNDTAVVDEIEDGADGERLARLVLEPRGEGEPGGKREPRGEKESGGEGEPGEEERGVGTADDACDADGRGTDDDGPRTLVVPVDALPESARRVDAVLDVVVECGELVSARVRAGERERRLDRNRRRLRRLGRRLGDDREATADRRVHEESDPDDANGSAGRRERRNADDGGPNEDDSGAPTADDDRSEPE